MGGGLQPPPVPGGALCLDDGAPEAQHVAHATTHAGPQSAHCHRPSPPPSAPPPPAPRQAAQSSGAVFKQRILHTSMQMDIAALSNTRSMKCKWIQ
ncbi:E3 ubiquitin-protein ligase TRIM71-like [Rhineura floridana]|uniref:E3 ubiquitin-protein ligase TRIM71-like n=1 Tax=Rhineura floridana TaxID=261503 RepID=UPI002AC83513|nr:E3 ubiquitin-protein ligase TRIM71-like [Rhineura floridana]